MRALAYVDNRIARNGFLALCIILASTGLYFGVGYFFLFGFPANKFLDWFWPMSCATAVLICETLAAQLIRHRRPQPLISALGTSILLTIVTTVMIAGILFLLARVTHP